MWIYEARPAVVLVAAFVILFSIAYLGHRLGRSAKARHPDMPELQDFIPSTIFGLLALILAFTFSMTVSRFENRLRLGVDEANAISTANLRTRLLRSGRGAAISAQLKRYLELRIAHYDVPFNSQKASEIENKLTRLQEVIWEKTAQATLQDRGPIEAVFVSSLNTMFDLRTSRDIALSKTLPRAIYWTILVIAACGLASFNFQRGQRGIRGQWQVVILVLIITWPYVLILDLDRPTAGAIRISQSPMVSLLSNLNRTHQ